MKDDKLAQEYLGNLERLLLMAPYIKAAVSNGKYAIHEGVLLLGFLQQLDWLAEERVS